MTQVLITKDKLDDLADAVSEKSGATTPLTVDEMTSAIQSIVTGGGIETELDPVFSASPAAEITSTDITKWNTPEIFLVTISSDNTSSTGYRSNKTYAEVVAALNAGKVVIGTSSNTYFSALSKNSTNIQFIYNRPNQVRQYLLTNASTEVTLTTTNLQKSLTWDTEPTEDSANALKSGAIYTALSTKQDSLPTISSGDAGKVLTINSTETGYEYTTVQSGGGGTTYSAGTGVNITNGTISIDDTVVALQTDLPTAVSDLTNDANYMSGMTILSYGTSTWNDFITAYRANHVVYCRASSNSNPATGSQTRMAFMAYVSNANNPTNVEFQYYRSVNAHSATQQGDQVYVYKLESNNTWSVTTREAMSKIVAGTNMTSSYANGTITLNASSQAPTITNTLASGELIATINGTNIYAPSYDDGDDLLYGG